MVRLRRRVPPLPRVTISKLWRTGIVVHEILLQLSPFLFSPYTLLQTERRDPAVLQPLTTVASIYSTKNTPNLPRRNGLHTDSPRQLWVSPALYTAPYHGRFRCNQENLTRDPSYVVLIALGAIPVLSFVQGNVVTMHRKPAGVQYPNAYATNQQAKDSQAAYKFNCAQRAHGNLLENMPQTMISLLFAGLEYPTAAAGLGAAWVLFRIIYAFGYIRSTTNGKGRMYGGAFWLVQAGLWGMCCSTALKML